MIAIESEFYFAIFSLAVALGATPLRDSGSVEDFGV